MIKLRTAIVGSGKVGHIHASALMNDPASEFVAVFNHTPDKAHAFAKQYGVNAFSNFETMIKDAGVEMISVCTPHPSHLQYIVAAAEMGVHVLCEKPLASCLWDCDQAIQACRTNHVKLGMVSQRRFYPPIQRMAKALKEGKIGKPILATLNVLGWRDEAYYKLDKWRGNWDTEGGGVLVNQTVHQLDLFQWLMGPISELFGYWDNLNHPYIEVEDTAVAVLRFESGALGQILVSNSQKPGFYGKLHIHGSSGGSIGAQTDGGSPFVAGVTTIVEAPFNDIWTVAGEEGLLADWQKEDRDDAQIHNPMTYYHAKQIADFLDAVRSDREPMINGEEARKSVELFTAIYRSQRDHAPIRFPLMPENDQQDFDGRLTHPLFSQRQEGN